MEILSATAILLLVMDPIGNLPMFMTQLENVPKARHRRVIVRELLAALGILILFLISGRWILELLSISESALGISGGVVLFMISIRMLFPGGRDLIEERDEEPFIVPLAVPLIAGPSTMSTLILMNGHSEGFSFGSLASLLLAWGVAAVVLLQAAPIRRRVGDRALRAMERLMGMLLVAVSVQMLIDGIQALR